MGPAKVAVNSATPRSGSTARRRVEFPEGEGIRADETGIGTKRGGTALCGLKLEAVMDKILNGISLDYLSRVMTDIHMDGSQVTQSLTSERQATLLNMVFNGNEMNRNKVNVFIAEKITPKLGGSDFGGDALGGAEAGHRRHAARVRHHGERRGDLRLRRRFGRVHSARDAPLGVF